MEDNLKFLKWKTTLIFGKWKTNSIFSNGRQPQYSFEWKRTPQTNLNGRRPKCFPNRRQPPKKMLQPKTIKSPNNCCGTAPGNLVSLP